tara:strand:- start:1044 stop:1217 length:174 start_codon:yes stop_codon:yes gene_type:complete
MKLTESRIKEIILEEIQTMSEEDMNSKTLEPKVIEILKQLPAEEQAIVNQYIASLKG